MKTKTYKLIAPYVAACAVLGATIASHAQVLLTVDPGQTWIGYMNVFALPANGGGYQFGTTWGTGALRGGFGNNSLQLSPCTNVWETTDAYWVQGDGVTPNEMMDANFYVQNDGLVNTNVVFIGKCVSNTLTANPEPLTGVSYTSVAFIKLFGAGYNLISSVTTNLTTGTAFTLTVDTTGASHVQYGFETEGPDANPSTAASLGNVIITNAAPSSLVTVDPSQNWIGYMNVFALPANGGGYQFGSPWGTSALQAMFNATTNTLTLSPCTNVWETNDTYWVQGDGMTPNKINDASMYVQNDGLANTNVVFTGICLSNTLTANPEPLTGVSYTSVAFIKAFNSSFGVIASAVSPALTADQAFALSLNTAGAAHVQYGFETVGPDANPSTDADLGNVVLAAGVPPPAGPQLTNAAPTPARPQSAVLSLYNSSGVYTNHPIERWLAGWSGSGESSFAIPGTGRTVLKYSNLQYAGVEFYNNDPTLGAGGDNAGGPINYSVNTTGYDTFHFDVWTPNGNQFGVQLVSINPTQPAQVDYLPAGGVITNYGWISIDIPLATFTSINGNIDLTDLQQMLWIDNQGGGGFIGDTFYIDNVYFYNSTAGAMPLLSAAISSGNINLSFATQNNSSYTIQYKTNMTDATWQTLTTVGGNGSVQTVGDPDNQTSRFYRLYVH